MKRYQEKRYADAAKIAAIEFDCHADPAQAFTLKFEDDADIKVSREFFEVKHPCVGDYYSVRDNEEGFMWPADAFEKRYELCQDKVAE